MPNVGKTAKNLTKKNVGGVIFLQAEARSENTQTATIVIVIDRWELV